MATPRQMEGSGTMAGRGEEMTTAELTQGIFYSDNNCPSFFFVLVLTAMKFPGMIITGEGVGEAQVQGNQFLKISFPIYYL